MIIFGEFWASEVAVICAGLLPDAQRQLSAMAIYQNTNDLCFTLTMGMSVACATRCVNVCVCVCVVGGK